MKLFTIGDSISQGFMSMAAARTDLSFSTLIAEQLGLCSGQARSSSYHFPVWEKGGMPLNAEELFRKLFRRVNHRIDLWEWADALITVNQFLDEVEDYYERGDGRADAGYNGPGDFYHNVAVRGFDVGDSWKMNSKVCKQILSDNLCSDKPDWWSGPSNSFYRTALKVLNPSLKEEYDEYSQLDWLTHHVKNEKEGVENTILWLGANNALEALLKMKIRQSPGDGSIVDISHEARARLGYNLWHPEDFEKEYSELLDKVENCMAENKCKDWKIFIGNVPLITIVPFARGLGRTTTLGDEGTYYEIYTYFLFDDPAVINNPKIAKLTLEDALFIDNSIRAYNRSINKLILKMNNTGRQRYFLVDISNALCEMASKRNNGIIKYKFPEYVRQKYPVVNTRYYQVDESGQIKQGGIFSLDGVHPTAIGQGLLAYEFLKTMQANNVTTISGKPVSPDLNWAEIYKRDSLYSIPLPIVNELFKHDKLKERLFPLITSFLKY